VDGRTPSRDGGALTIDFAGEEVVVRPPGTLTFGRAGDLVVDDNPYLHRLVGRFSWDRDVWWLENLGHHIELTVLSGDGSVTRLPPRVPGGRPAVTSLASPAFRVLFDAAGARYELAGRVAPTPIPAGTPGGPSADLPPGAETTRYGRIPLTDDERRMLLLLAAPALRDPTSGPEDLRPSREIAHRLGWPITKFNRKLDYLCVRLSKAGVRGLQGGRGTEATNRRWRLVEHAINVRLVTPAELDGLAADP
jgi:hypothetical protein